MKRSTAKVLFPALAAILLVGYLLFTGPHMLTQQKIGPFQASFPPSPKGSVPVRNPVSAMPTTREAQLLVSAVQPTAKNLSAGGVYYGYYCVFCHGSAGDGRGPVGESFVRQSAGPLRRRAPPRDAHGPRSRACASARRAGGEPAVPDPLRPPVRSLAGIPPRCPVVVFRRMGATAAPCAAVGGWHVPPGRGTPVPPPIRCLVP